MSRSRGADGGHQIGNETDWSREHPETGWFGVALEGAEWEFHRRDDDAPNAGPG